MIENKYKYSFLMCSERSGSNLLTSMLDTHAEIFSPPPLHIIRHTANNLALFGSLDNDNNWENLIHFVNEMYKLRIGGWDENFCILNLINEKKNRELIYIIKHIYETSARVHNNKNIFIKENYSYTFISYILHAFPESKYIWLVRDPRDVALSWKKAGVYFQGESIENAGVLGGAKVWKNSQDKFLSIYNNLYETGRVLLVKYEDLITVTEKTLIKICSHLEVDYDDNMLKHNTNLKDKNIKKNALWENIFTPVMKNNMNKYLNELNHSEIKYIEGVCHKEMKRLGYDCKNLENNVENKIDYYEEIIKKEYKKNMHYKNRETENIFKRRKTYFMEFYENFAEKCIYDN